MSLGTILYWVAFGFVVVFWLGMVAAFVFGGGPLGYSRNSVESTPTDSDGRH